MATLSYSKTRSTLLSANSRREGWSYQHSTTICCTRRLASCISTLSAGETRWNWQREFGRHWRSPRAHWARRHQRRRRNPKSRPRSNESSDIKGAWEEMCSTSLSRGMTSMWQRWATMVPGSMGMNTPFNFQLDGKNAAINGDFMLRPSELNPVIKALQTNGIEVASIHNHLLDNEPQLVFMHFWAYGDAVGLAKGLREALDRTGA